MITHLTNNGSQGAFIGPIADDAFGIFKLGVASAEYPGALPQSAAHRQAVARRVGQCGRAGQVQAPTVAAEEADCYPCRTRRGIRLGGEFGVPVLGEPPSPADATLTLSGLVAPPAAGA